VRFPQFPDPWLGVRSRAAYQAFLAGLAATLGVAFTTTLVALPVPPFLAPKYSFDLTGSACIA
jgi:hypothetical protein